MSKCSHLDQINPNIERKSLGCEECMKTGDSWERVRICLTCGHVGCDDESKNKHARKHFEETGHPIIASGEPNRHWRWCYIDEEYV